MLFERKDISAFIQLIKLGIGHPICDLSKEFKWDSIKSIADRHGLSAVILDGIENLPEAKIPSKELILQWIGEVLKNYENRYEQYSCAISELSSLFNEHGLKMMVLKGYTCSLDWPVPEHRPCGDIDIWMFGKQKEADDLVATIKGIRVDAGEQHHTVFYWRDFMVENHYDFINVYAHKSNAELEKEFKELGTNDSFYVDVYDEKVYLPSPNLHALFLVKHMASHFAASEISFRHVLDWAFFVDKHTNEIDWVWLTSVLEKYGMKDFFNLINAICVDDLGFSEDLFPENCFLPEMKERVLNDILEPAYVTAEPTNLVPRMLYKFLRWKGNSWKHDLCYDESRWSAFWYGVRNHLIKPSSL